MSNLFTSSIGKKLIMSITGLFLVLFLLFHMCMNLVAIFSQEAYNMICAFLGANWYALAATVVLAAGAVIHIIYAFILTILNRRARGKQRYAVEATPKGVEWASQNMFVLGLIIVVGLVLHLWNFWYNMQFVELAYSHAEIEALGLEPTNGAALIAGLFSNPVYCIVYLVWLAALWFHLTHGFWSAFQTIGWDNQIWRPRVMCISNIVATIIFLGFAAVVVYFYAISLCPGGVCY
ncbi:MAG: succinate dehydrogenase/fumarate reductase cytochrome b subunit [Rikenellaceae bacterium]|nr:succinate dehydrogenase/fumarate reductase cytochrome b subunit [Rikenellaceae bacterium]